MELLVDTFRHARSDAIFGKYASAKDKYDEVLHTIQHNRMSLDGNAEEQQKWDDQSVMCKAERDMILELEAEWGRFPSPDASPRRAAPFSARGANPDKKRGHFQPPSEADDYLANFQLATSGFGLGRKVNKGEDPDVWSPPPQPMRKQQGANFPARQRGPPQIDRHQSERNVAQPAHHQRAWARPKLNSVPPQSLQRKSTPPQTRGVHSLSPRYAPGGPRPGAPPSSGRGVSEGSRREYEKPWKKPPPEDERGRRGKGDDSPFFQHMCPHGGASADADLVRQVESNILEKVPGVSFNSVAGLENAIKLLKEAVIFPLKMPFFFVGIRRPWKGIMLYGPPGTGKTTLAKAVATECNSSFMNVSVGSLASKWRGDSERMIRIIFECARFYAPSTIFFDEIDAIGGKRGGDGEHEASRRLKSELLTQMDGLNNDSENEEGSEKKQVTVLAATNRPWDLDEALRRRLEKRIYIPLPDEGARKKAFELNMHKMNCAEDVDYDVLTKKSNGYSCADIASVCRDAAMMPLRQAISQGMVEDDIVEKFNAGNHHICMQDFIGALENVPKSVGTKDLKEFEEWTEEFGTKFNV